jgi:phosphoglucomutase
VKVTAASGWFAARTPGTEAIRKIYAEGFCGKDHLAQIEVEAQSIVYAVFTATAQADAALRPQETI